MAPTAADTGVLVVDIQQGPLSLLRPDATADLKHHLLAFARAVQVLKIPVAILRAAIPGDQGELLPGLADCLPRAVSISHTHNNAWEEPAVREWVGAHAPHNLIVCGIATDVGVLLVAIAAQRAGLRVWVPLDACATVSATAQRAAELRLTQAGVIPTSWSGLVGEIQGDYTRSPGPELQAILHAALSAGHDTSDPGRP
jgi:nicotinamidase-related amidase